MGNSVITKLIITDWSHPLEGLRGKNKTEENVFRLLRERPLISTFALSENYKWLCPILERLELRGKIKDVTSTVKYPYHKFIVL